MNADRLSGFALIAAVIVAALLIGCAGSRRRPAADPAPSKLAGTLRDIGAAPAALAVSEPMRPFFYAGLGFIVLGGLVLCCGGKGTGLVLLGLGAATTATGVLFVQYPWAVLVLALAAGVAAALAVHDRCRARRELRRNGEALEAAALVIQTVPEGRAIKKGLAALGDEVEEMVRSVVTPIKDKLRREGKIA